VVAPNLASMRRFFSPSRTTTSTSIASSPARSKRSLRGPGSSATDLPSSRSATTAPSTVTLTSETSFPDGSVTKNVTVGRLASTSVSQVAQSVLVRSGQVDSAHTANSERAAESFPSALSFCPCSYEATHACLVGAGGGDGGREQRERRGDERGGGPWP
jgi:hypothetical protein